MKYLFALIFLTISSYACCQKFYVSPNLGMQFATLDYCLKGNNVAKDFHVPRPKLLETYGFCMYYKKRAIVHKLSLQRIALGLNFKIDRYKANNELVGDHRHMSSLDHFLLGYSVQKEVSKNKKFIGHVKLKYNASIGAGIGFNQSKSYYNQVYSSGHYYTIYQTGNFYGHDYSISRKGFGIFLMPQIGFDLFNRRGKRFLNIDLFYYQGLKNMIYYNLHYYYGNTNDNLRVDHDQIIRSRGTVFGLKIGVPIRLVN